MIQINTRQLTLAKPLERVLNFNLRPTTLHPSPRPRIGIHTQPNIQNLFLLNDPA